MNFVSQSTGYWFLAIFAVIIIVGVLGIATDYFFKVTYKIFFPWMEK